MKQILNNQERSRLDQRLVEAEKKTGAQVVLAVIDRSDSYAEIPWKAFALAVSVAGLFVFLHAMLWPEWTAKTTVLLALAATLTAGLVCALMAVYLPWFARFFLNAHRKEVEVRQYAESLFLSRELFSTSKRSGILLLVSVFERQILVLPDRGIKKRLREEAMQEIISLMTPSLASGRIAHALEEGLERLEETLAATATGDAGGNELPDEIIEERGS
ncbi:MAG: TPM domain-containing protein [Syntrophaceae bacterium]